MPLPLLLLLLMLLLPLLLPPRCGAILSRWKWARVVTGVIRGGGWFR